jgi:hypothetical protein
LVKAEKQIQFRRKSGRRRLINIGGREIETRGLAGGFWTDLYHRSMTVHWPVFFATAAAIFIILNTAFAFLYWLGNEPIANVASNEPLGLFYFSVETLATVGYADRLRAFHRHNRNLHRNVLPRGDDRTDLCSFFAAARPLHLRQKSGRDHS